MPHMGERGRWPARRAGVACGASSYIISVRLQAEVGAAVVADVLQIVNHAAIVAAQLANALLAHIAELLVSHRNDGTLI